MIRQLMVLICAATIPFLVIAQETDYAAMRMEFASRTNYNAYLIQAVEKALIAECMTAWRAGDTVAAFSNLNAAVDACPVSIEAHRRLADAYGVLQGKTEGKKQKTELKALEDKHRDIAEGLVRSVVASGDGRTPKTAYRAISIPEEYMTLWFLGLDVIKQELDEGKHGTFDVFTVTDREGSKQKVYFDISKFKKGKKTSNNRVQPTK